MARFIIKSFGFEAAVFDRASGDTHYLSPLAKSIYSACLEHPSGPCEKLVLLAAAQLGITPESVPLSEARDVLNHLHRIGLVDTK